MPIDRMTRKVVRVPGFRNSLKAPTPMKVKPMAEAFEKSPDLVAAILSAWAEARPVLRQQVYDLLVARGWDILPPEADRTQLPGFFIKWPHDEDFEKLNSAYSERYPDAQETSDDVSLMVVWVSTRLPYQIDDEEDEDLAADTSGEESTQADEA
jgi:hypothetical protein